MRSDWRDGQLSRTVDLDYDQLLVLHDPQGTRVRVLYGRLWLTEEGCAQDVFAAAGSELTVRGRGRTVIEGLGRTRVQLLSPLAVGRAAATAARIALAAARTLDALAGRLRAAAQAWRPA